MYGRANAAGTSSDPFDDIGDAAQRAGRGDTILVRPGLYEEAVYLGTKGVTLRSTVEHGAVIDAAGWSGKVGVHIAADRVTVDGFEVRNADRSGIAAFGAHDVEITDNFVHHNKRAGIGVHGCDDVLIAGNETSYNASSTAASGITVHRSANLTRPGGGGGEPGYDIVVRDNYSHHNYTHTPGKHTDGNGIILDDNRSTKNEQPEYRGHILVEDNRVQYNGGAGILAVWSDHVDIVGNFSRGNNRDLDRRGYYRAEIEVRHSSDVDVRWNVAIANDERHPGNHALGNRSSADYENEDVFFWRNVTWNGTPGDASVLVSDGDARPLPVHNWLGTDPSYVVPDEFSFRGIDLDWLG